MKGRIAAIVVTYNRKEMVKNCIEFLAGQEGASADIMIIDNASTDGTREYIDTLIDGVKVKYYNTGANLGGAGGFQWGIRKAYEEGYDYYWIMDDDTYVRPDTLAKLCSAADELKENFGFLSSITRWKDGSLCDMNVQRTGLHKKIEEEGDNLTPIVMATFVSFMTTRKVVKELGLPIKEFFIWSDDLEYSRRISKKYPCYLVRESEVLHNMASNEKVGIESESLDRLWRYERLYRNEVYVFRREGLKGWLYIISRVLMHSFRVIKSDKTDKKTKLKTIWKSFFAGLKFHPEIEFAEE